MLIVGRNESLVGEMLAATVADAHLRFGEAVEMTIVDLMAVDGPLSSACDALGIPVVRRRGLPDLLLGLAADVERLHSDGTQTGRDRVLVMSGLGKARDLDVDDYSDEGQQLSAAFASIARDGPEVGVHLVVWGDSAGTVDRRLGRTEREFGCRVAMRMSADDSLRICDSEAAAQLRDHEAVLIDLDRGTSVKFQPFAEPHLTDQVDGGA